MGPPEAGGPESVRVVLVTAPDTEVGGRLARALVEARLAACVNIVPAIRSVYRWKGEIEDDAEVLLIIKTRADRLADVCDRVGDLHPYDLPEVLALPAAGGSAGYLAWVQGEVTP